MIFDSIEFHNVEELQPSDGGYRMWRLPRWVRESINEQAGKSSSGFATGVELRFKMKSDQVTLYLSAENMAEATVAYIYYGSIQGGWEDSSRVIFTQKTPIRIRKANNVEVLKRISKENDLPFSPEIVRVVLPYGSICYWGMEGEVEPPTKDELPKKTYLAYGSSITHGSLALAAPYTYPFRLSQKFRCDYLNMGFAGSAWMEKAMAEYIVSRKDWDFATVEMGINMLGTELDEFERNIDIFTMILQKDPRPVFATNIYGFSDPSGQEKGRIMRSIVEKYAKNRLIFTDGLRFLNNPAFIAQDMVHPSLEGIEQIGDRWFEVINGHNFVRNKFL